MNVVLDVYIPLNAAQVLAGWDVAGTGTRWWLSESGSASSVAVADDAGHQVTHLITKLAFYGPSLPEQKIHEVRLLNHYQNKRKKVKGEK